MNTITQLNKQIEEKNELKKGLVSKLNQLEVDLEKDGDNVETVKSITLEIDKTTNDFTELEKSINDLQVEKKGIEKEINDLKKSTKSDIGKAKNDNNDKESLKLFLSSDSYEKAFEKGLKSGNMADVEQMSKAYTTSVDGENNGGVFIPTVISEIWEEKVKTSGRILSLVTKIESKSYVEFPVVRSRSGASEDIENPAKDKDVQTGKFDSVAVKASIISKMVEITTELEAMSGTSFLTYIASETFDEVIKEAENLIINGDRTNREVGLKGIVSSDNFFVPKLDGFGILNWPTFLNLMASVDDGIEKSSCYVMNKKTYFNHIMTITDSTNRPVYNVISENGAMSYMLNGMPVIFNASLKAYDIATAEDAVIIFGDLSAYKANLPKGNTVELMKDPYTKMGQNKNRYYASMIAGGDVTGVEKIAVLKKGTPAAGQDGGVDNI